MQAILLAAGFGTRLRPYTTLRPKPLFPVLNRPLLLRSLDQLQACGCRRVVVNAHHLADRIAAALAPYPEVEIQIEPEILGTGGSLRLAMEGLADEPLLVVNGDLCHAIDLARVYRRHLRDGNEVTLALHDFPRFNQVEVAGGRVRGFKGRGTLAFTGIHVVNPEVIGLIPASGFFHIIDLYRQLAEQGRVGFCRVDGSLWRDIGTPGDYLQLHGELLAGQGGDWLIDPAARLGEDVELSGWGCIGAGAIIGAGARLCRAVIWDGAVVPPGIQWRDAIVTGDPEIDGQTGRREGEG